MFINKGSSSNPHYYCILTVAKCYSFIDSTIHCQQHLLYEHARVSTRPEACGNLALQHEGRNAVLLRGPGLGDSVHLQVHDDCSSFSKRTPGTAKCSVPWSPNETSPPLMHDSSQIYLCFRRERWRENQKAIYKHTEI